MKQRKNIYNVTQQWKSVSVLGFPLRCIGRRIWPSIEFTAWSFTNAFGKRCRKNRLGQFKICQEYPALPWKYWLHLQYKKHYYKYEKTLTNILKNLLLFEKLNCKFRKFSCLFVCLRANARFEFGGHLNERFVFEW